MKLRKASALFMAAAMSASMFVVPAAADETEDCKGDSGGRDSG